MSSDSESDSGSELNPEEMEDMADDHYALYAEQHRKNPKKKLFRLDEYGLQQKEIEIKLKIDGFEDIPFSEIMVVPSKITSQEMIGEDAEDDLKRERVFYDQAVGAIIAGTDLLIKEGIPYQRPDDYYAEMIKADQHMSKVKGNLLREKRKIDEAIERRKQRTSRKFAKEVQQQVKENRKAQKDADLSAIKQWRVHQKRGAISEEFPAELLDSKSQIRQRMDNNMANGQRKPNPRREMKNKQYGGRGRNRDRKRNSAESSGDMSSFDPIRNKYGSSTRGGGGGRGGRGGGRGGNRPGKRARQVSGGGGAGGGRGKRGRN